VPRAGDILCRYGGEEIAMIMPEMTAAIAQDRAARLCEAARPLNVQHGGQKLGGFTISACVVVFPDHAADGAALLQAVDAASTRRRKAGATGW
jgi:diguanylate cyclase (GGDEF)-like protein